MPHAARHGDTATFERLQHCLRRDVADEDECAIVNIAAEMRRARFIMR